MQTPGPLSLALLLALLLASLSAPLPASPQDAAPANANPVNTRARPGALSADSPVAFPPTGALPALFPPDQPAESWPVEPDFYLFSSPCRSLPQIQRIQAAMPEGRFRPPPQDWLHLPRTRRRLTEGGPLHLMAIGDSIVNDTMRSGWVALLREAYPRAHITATVYVRGGGGAQHYRESNRVAQVILPRRPDLVLLGGISQRSIEDLADLIAQLRSGLPDLEILLTTGAFGTADPRDAAALAHAPHSGTGDYGRRLRQLAADQRCAFLDLTTPWAEYLNSSGQHPHRFYRDVVHANEFGEQVLARILLAFWQPESPPPPPAVHPLTCDAQTRSAPRPLRLHVLRLDLRDPHHQLDVLLAQDPDGPGPAEAALTPPAVLLDAPDLVAAINANAFAHLAPPPPGRSASWLPGDPVDITGWAKAPSRVASRPTASESSWCFWLTSDGRARVSPLEPRAGARLAIAGFSPLLVQGRPATDAGGPLHPRTAIGVDASGYQVILLVVDGRQPGTSEGLTLHELAAEMAALGAYEALNLDGGGSSILFHRDPDGTLTIRNRPAARPPRPLPVMLVVRANPGSAVRPP